jgi:cysteine-rich repeat protein
MFVRTVVPWLSAILLGMACGRGTMSMHGSANPDASDGPIGQAGSDVAVAGDRLVGLDVAASDERVDKAVADLQTEGIQQGCGNGRYDRGEECDDGNTQSGDGCSSRCKLECSDAGVDLCIDPGFFPDNPWTLCCVVTRRIVCGDGIRDSIEVCDDGNASAGDGCSGDCQVVEPGYRCTVPGMRCTPTCGDGMVKGSETCDDGNRDEGDGCSRFCLTEPGWDCSTGVCVRLASNDGGWHSTPALYCGDGIVSGAEECDLGPENSDSSYSGCSTECTYLYCGDGIVTGDEQCDLGEANGKNPGSEGCTIGCSMNHFCGDGNVDTDRHEECDFGDRNGVKLDKQLNPSDAEDAVVYCYADCTIPPHLIH